MSNQHHLPSAIERSIESFESRARASRAPSIESVIDALGPLTHSQRAALLMELVAIDLEFRWQSPHRRGPLLELYVKQLGQWATLDDVPLELIAEEYPRGSALAIARRRRNTLRGFRVTGRRSLSELTRVDDELAAEYPTLPRQAATAGSVDDGPISDGESLDYRDYAIRRLIAAGGMSRVYTAIDKRRQQPVALKVLNKSLSRQALSVRRFVREARIAASLEISHVVTAQGLGRFPDGGYFLALRLVDGLDLERRINEAPIGAVKALELLRGIATIVAELHNAGWLHCDLKPSNVLIDSQGQPWLTDFAMAQPAAPPGGSNQKEDCFALGGTPAFMAPEQQAGDAALLSPATDIYALGGILHALLTGRPPTPSAMVPENLSPRCTALLQRCLANGPGDRYRTCDELLAELATVSQDVPPRAGIADDRSLAVLMEQGAQRFARQ